MEESHGTVFQWLNTTFGAAPSNFRIATRANEELAEAFRALAAGNFRDAQIECSDVIIVLCRPAWHFKLDWGHFEIVRPAMPVFTDMAAYLNEANRWMGQLLCALAIDDKHYDAPRCIQKCYRALQGAIDHVAPGNNGPAHQVTCKMATNRAREWKKHGDGTGYHVREYKGLRKIGTFMEFPLYVVESLPDDSFVLLKRKLEPEPLNPTPDFLEPGAMSQGFARRNRDPWGD